MQGTCPTLEQLQRMRSLSCAPAACMPPPPPQPTVCYPLAYQGYRNGPLRCLHFPHRCRSVRLLRDWCAVCHQQIVLLEEY